MKKPELISPAGTLEKLKIAFEYGADAVYAGVPDFSLRARINEFDYKKMRQGVKYAHERGKKVYATLNIYARNSDLKKIETAVKKYHLIGVDAVIVSDPGILKAVKKIAPKMEIHLSTQANCTNFEAAKFWMEQGVKRIVLAREITLDEIAEIHKKLPRLELEYFVHGAMCMSYSGRCILSKWLSGRSANLGECSQPCRWEYDIESHPLPLPSARSGQAFVKGGNKENAMEIEEDKNGTYIFNSKDLCLIEHLDKLWKAGITSFKIEGRTKSAYYVAAITKLYREGIYNIFKFKTPQPPFEKGGVKEECKEGGIKEYFEKWEIKYAPPKGWKFELEKITNRGYTTGFLFGEEKCEHNFLRSHEECEWQFVGEVVEEGRILNFKSIRQAQDKLKILKKDQISNDKFKKWEDGEEVREGKEGIENKIYIKIHNALCVGDEVEFVVPRGENMKMKIKKMYDTEDGAEIKEAHGGQGRIIFLRTDKIIPERSMVRRKIITNA
ncbi:MAG: U32 family peptidase [bacterium]